MEEKFDFAALMNHKPRIKINYSERNKPNFEKMAEAFAKLLK